LSRAIIYLAVEMSTPIGQSLPREILDALDGTELRRKIGPAHLLVTSDEDGTPRPCMLSAGELLAVDERALRLALWAGSHTSKNLSRGAPALFCYVAPRAVFHVRGRARRLPSGDGLDCFQLDVESVESDDHPGMPVTSGISFRVEEQDPGEVIDVWERQLAALRDA
jgi:hypothetical protein